LSLHNHLHVLVSLVAGMLVEIKFVKQIFKGWVPCSTDIIGALKGNIFNYKRYIFLVLDDLNCCKSFGGC